MDNSIEASTKEAKKELVLAWARETELTGDVDLEEDWESYYKQAKSYYDNHQLTGDRQ